MSISIQNDIKNLVKQQQFNFEVSFDPATNKLFNYANNLINQSGKPIEIKSSSFLVSSTSKMLFINGALIEQCTASCTMCDFKIKSRKKKYFTKMQLKKIIYHMDKKHSEIDINMIWKCKNVTRREL